MTMEAWDRLETSLSHMQITADLLDLAAQDAYGCRLVDTVSFTIDDVRRRIREARDLFDKLHEEHHHGRPKPELVKTDEDDESNVVTLR
jgi:hypothetical protein